MASPEQSSPFPSRHRAAIVVALCALGAYRVFFFAAAFPFFGNMDEPAHLDTIVKYAEGDLPARGRDVFSPTTARLVATCGSWEFFSSPDQLVASGPPPCPWKLPPAEAAEYIRVQAAPVLLQANDEAFSPPVYYLIAAGWYRGGRLLGLTDLPLLYWVRFLNVLLYGALIGLAAAFCHRVYPDRDEIGLLVAGLLVFFPQDVMYAINSDVLSPVLFLAALYLLTEAVLGDRGVAWWGLAGLAVAATMLVKLSNLAILAVLLVVLASSARRWQRAGVLRARAPRLLAALAAAGLPLVLWCAWNYWALGDLTGSAIKVEHLGWRLKPFAAVWSHPLFTSRGMATFLSGLTATFWRGELVWHGQRLADRFADGCYVFTTVAFLLAAAGGLRRRWCAGEKAPVQVELMLFLAVLVSVLFLAAISVAYDFGTCFFPSARFPYFTSGRLIAGVMVPFLILYVQGLTTVFRRCGGWRAAALMGVLLAGVISWSELRQVWPVLGSEFNWFNR